MIVQIAMVRDELPLLKELLPIWKEYVDGFVFLTDTCTDRTEEYLQEVKDQFNILEVLTYTESEGNMKVETENRQLLFDTAKKYSNKIICLDADEYLDGDMTKDELEDLLENNPDTVYHLQWIQYTSVNTIRVDGPWANNYKDRIGVYQKDCQFTPAQMHSTHLPIPANQQVIYPENLFIAHLQWMNKTFVGIKQYFWKVTDYVNHHLYNIDVAGSAAYDASINNFEWQEEYTYNLLKTSPCIYDSMATYGNYRLAYIKEQVEKYNIPPLGDWGLGILELDNTEQIQHNKYKLSVVTAIGPLDKYAKFIPRYLESVLDQHFFKQTEHIIVYSEWDESFNDFLNYDNFKLIKEQERKGVYNAWNIGIQQATTDYITNWNIDDIRHPINTKIKYDAIVGNNYDVVYNWYIATEDIDENFYNIEIHPSRYLRYPDNYQDCVMDNCYAGPDPLWKKSLHDEVGYFDYENFNTIGDWEMWIRFAKSGAKFKLIPEPLCIYLSHGDTVSNRQQNKVLEEKQRLFKKYEK